MYLKYQNTLFSDNRFFDEERWLTMKKGLIGLFLVLGTVSFANYGKIEARGGID